MAADLLIYLAAGALALWGAAHLAATRPVVAGFGSLSTDSRRILTMEWIAEGLAHIGVAGLVATVAAATDDGERVVEAACWTAAGFLVAVSALALLTGARTPVVWFKACPVVLASVAVMLVVAGRLSASS